MRPTARQCPRRRLSHPCHQSAYKKSRTPHSLGDMDPFNFAEVRIKQPARLLPGRASYEIFDDSKQLVGVATEVEGRSVIDKITKVLPESRVLMITTAAGDPMMTLSYQGAKWLAQLTDPDDQVIGTIRIAGSRRHYTLMDAEGAEIAQ